MVQDASSPGANEASGGDSPTVIKALAAVSCDP